MSATILPQSPQVSASAPGLPFAESTLSGAPFAGSQADLLARAVGFAVLAPSSHNTQPWLFDLRWNGLEIILDRSRVLPVADPGAREMVMSCGAALQNIRVALRYLGFAAKVKILPHESVPDVLARVELGGRRVRSKLNELLFAAIPGRHTSRAPYASTPVSARLVAAMRTAAELEGASLHQTTDAELRPIVADFIARGDRQQWVDRKFRQEHAAWLRPNTGPHRDGLPGYLFGMSNIVARIAPAVMRRMPLGRIQANHHRALALEAPLLVTLTTPGDTPRDWMAAGQALQLVLLVAAAHGISASFLNQPLQLPALRARFRARLGLSGFPQVILRMGFAPPSLPTLRRDVAAVLGGVAFDGYAGDVAVHPTVYVETEPSDTW